MFENTCVWMYTDDTVHAIGSLTCILNTDAFRRTCSTNAERCRQRCSFLNNSACIFATCPLHQVCTINAACCRWHCCSRNSQLAASCALVAHDRFLQADWMIRAARQDMKACTAASWLIDIDSFPTCTKLETLSASCHKTACNNGSTHISSCSVIRYRCDRCLQQGHAHDSQCCRFSRNIG